MKNVFYTAHRKCNYYSSFLILHSSFNESFSFFLEFIEKNE